MANNNTRQTQRQEQKNKTAQAATVMASELLNLTPEDIENRVRNETDSNSALEKSDRNDEVSLDNSPREATEPKSFVYTYARGVSPKAIEMFEQTATNSETLIEHMEEQITSSALNERQQLIATYIVGSLDRNGYFYDDPYNLADDITFNEGIDVSEQEVITVLGHIQQMDPIGVGARDMQECMLLQLAQRNTQYTPIARQIISKCYDDFKRNRRDHIAATLKLTVEFINEVYDKEIRKLDPKPGSSFDTSDNDLPPYVTPTFIINVDDDVITYEIPSRIPELHISEAYTEALDDLNGRENLSDNDRDTRESIKENVDKANVFVSALQMRQETLKQTIEAIIHFQHDFFVNNGDPSCLKPMKLKDLAAYTGRDASVLSRATSDKYMSTPWGIMRVRELFSESGKVTNAQGEQEDVATSIIKNRLKQIVDAEDKRKPLSDEKIAQMLQAEGYTISRRTVNKYRDQLGIPAAKLRRNY